jgi:hypothetical protein
MQPLGSAAWTTFGRSGRPNSVACRRDASADDSGYVDVGNQHLAPIL